MKVGVVTFPGSLDDRDALRAIRLAGGDPVALWHGEHDLHGVDALVLPGGFSYGDYLRCGAIAAHSPIMAEVIEAAHKGMPVLGICNGFQVLAETGVLPGALLRNVGLKYICKTVGLNVVTSQCAYTEGYSAGDIIDIPIAHHDGNYFADDDTIARLQGEDRVAFTYTENPNGAKGDIAGILSANKRVLGMMPHPERAADAGHGGTDGQALFRALSGILTPA